MKRCNKKRNKMYAAVALITAAMLALNGCGVSVTSSEIGNTDYHAPSGPYSVIEKKMPVYFWGIDDKEEIGIHYINGGTVPYISIADLPHLLEKACDDDHTYEIAKDHDEGHVVITRDNDYYTADFDFENDTIKFQDYDAFLKNTEEALVSLGSLSAPFPYLFQQMEDTTNDRYGHVMLFDLKPYGIDLVDDGNGYYIPLQTASDLFVSYYVQYILCNGESVIMTGGLDDDLSDIYYSVTPKERTEEFAQFDYHELCFALDNLYGLKEIHDISSFDEYFYEVGLRKKMLSPDQSDADYALFKLITCYLDDLHSSYYKSSYNTDQEAFLDKIKGTVGPWRDKYVGWIDKFSDARDKAYPDGVPHYEEVGDTAYITFDHFSSAGPDTDYRTEPTTDELDDTTKLMQYSYKQILRPNSPIKNVVMDLSINTGGSINMACYVIATYLGYGSINVKNTMTGASTTSQYRIDSNMDGKFDSKDTLAGKGLNLFCLTSPISFSCGNLVPNEFKTAPTVTLLGMTSGGGSCSVQPLTTAGGSIFDISGYRRMSVFKNGSFYDIDRGAEPDLYISKISDFYDRPALTDYINSLF